MLDVPAALHRVRSALDGAATWLRTTLGAAGLPVPVDAELEQRLRRLVDELKYAPLVQPSRDLAQEVIDHLQRLQDHQLPPADDE